MAINKVNFSAGGEDLSDIYLSTEEAGDRLNDGSIPSSILTDEGITAIQSRSLWVWGPGAAGLNGLNSTINRSSPVQIGTLTSWYDANVDTAISVDGSFWGWGPSLLFNTTLSRSSPTQVGTSLDWKNTFARSFATKRNNQLWAWGTGTDGILGLNDTITRSSPIQVGTLTNWKQVDNGSFNQITPFGPTPGIFIRRRGGVTVSVKTDGTLWSWGMNKTYGADNGGLGVSPTTTGALGLNSSIDRSSPVQVGTLTDWKSVSISVSLFSHAVAVKNDGTLWTWGNGFDGELGHNDVISRSSPVQVGTLTNWKQAQAGCISIKTDGTLWAWGSNSSGGSGLNNTINRSSPVQVGALTNWKSVYGAASRNIIKTDGTWWSWSSSVLNDILSRSSPVQVGTDTNWGKIRGTTGLKK